LGEGFLWAEPPVDFCNENETYEHIHEAPSASASDPRPLAESLVPRRLRSVPGKTRPKTTLNLCAVRDAPPVHDQRRVLLRPSPTSFRPRETKMHTWTDYPEAKGPQPFGRFAGLPPSKAAEHPPVTDPLPRKTGVLPPRLA